MPNEPGSCFCEACDGFLDVSASVAKSASGLPGSFVGGRYRVTGLLGEGDSKTVHLAHDMRLRRDVAFAVVKFDRLDEAARARVKREARSLARLADHPHLVTIFDVGQVRGRPYIVSQYMEGGSLESRLKRPGSHRLPIADAVRIAVEVCEALEHAHLHGVLHRDLKPSNILFAAGGATKLGDLGFGLILATELSRILGASMAVTTVAYTAPEQALAQPFDARSDLYSLGVILYEMVVGRPPFMGDTLAAIVNQHLNQFPSPPSWRVPEIPEKLEAIILRLLEKSPHARPQSAAAVRDELRAIALEFQGAAPSPAAPKANGDDADVAGLRSETLGSKSARRVGAIRAGVARRPALLTASLAATLAISFGWARTERVLRPHQASRSGEASAAQGLSRLRGRGSLSRRRQADPAPEPELVALANAGDEHAQSRLGDMYLRGRGVSRDDGQALKWLLKAAEQGDTDAKVDLGRMYAKGEGVAQDYAEALQFFYQAAAQGNRDAEYHLARLYMTGEGVAHDFSVALEWLNMAAAQGCADAEYQLGTMYRAGDGVTRDMASAVQWMRKAALHGRRDAAYEMGTFYLLGQGLAQDDAQAARWFLKAAERDDPRAQNAIGYMFEQGQGVAQDYDQALKWYSKAASQGDAKAQLNLGTMYQNGEGVAQNFARAARLFHAAALNGDDVAQTSLGLMYWNGRGVARDDREALHWLAAAARHGNPQAQYALGAMYDKGRGVRKDYAQAAQWYRRAASKGNRDAQYNLGYMYEYGQGVSQDLAEAVQWYRRAAGQADPDAHQKLTDFVTGPTAPATVAGD